ncbi:MAG TPA: DNA-directed RNA polymerase subunit K [Candidatus Altiarchaeales archaeon]|nr:DNA-directed RNA polymerase subunit K [Candidatus Altiarchaeales archaeon]
MEYTKYERARIVGARALQIQLGAPVFIKVSDPFTRAIDIAKIELENDLIPITVKRK